MIRLSLSATHAVIVLFVFITQQLAAQQSTLPCGLEPRIYAIIPETSFQAIDTSLLSKTQSQASKKISSATVAYNFKTRFTPDTDGHWKSILAGIDSWFIRLRSRNAYGLALVLSGVQLEHGETLYIYNQHGVHGPFTNRNIPPSGILPLDFLKGDEIMVEYDVPAGRKNHGSFVVETVSHAYRNVFGDDRKKQSARFSDDCYLCLEDESIAKQRRAIVKLVVQYENSTKLCTGTLVNNTANDRKPYILTAEHCVSNQSDADRTVFIFGFEDEDCMDQTSYDLALNGAYHRASLFENDFSLLELYDKPPLEFRPYYAGWDISDVSLSGVTCIHHAQGGPKRVSVSNSTIRTSNLEDGPPRSPGAFWKVARWDAGATEAGSSGASLLNKNGYVIGTLSGGSSQCSAPYNDYYSKLSASWEASSDPEQQLKYWLDPLGSGVKTLDGIDPFEDIHAICNTLSNAKPGEQQTLLPYTGGEGYFSGYNSDNIASYAEKFSVTDTAMLTGVMLNVGSVNPDSPGSLHVRIHNSNEGLPGTVLSESFVPYSRLTRDTLHYVSFYPYIKLAGEFFISYTLSYSPDDFFALKQTAWRNNTDNTAFVKLPSGWVPVNTISPNGKGSSLGINVIACENAEEPPDEETAISFYPNPVTTVLIGKLPDRMKKELQVGVYDLQGGLHRVSYNIYDNSVVITTADIGPGMYIVRVSTLDAVYQAKFVKH